MSFGWVAVGQDQPAYAARSTLLMAHSDTRHMPHHSEDPSTFQYARFRSLCGQELVNYVEPFLRNSTTPVTREAVQCILRDMVEWDELHLIYALELGAVHAPQLFLAHAITSLRDPRGAVRCAAARFWRRAPDALITPEIVESIQAALAHSMDLFPPKELFEDLVLGLSARSKGS
jgi:hypothetical protein